MEDEVMASDTATSTVSLAVGLGAVGAREGWRESVDNEG
jgi:hypothetical protein